jgi:hypothetical protein
LEHYKGAFAEHLTKYFEGKEAFEWGEKNGRKRNNNRSKML